MFVIQAVYTSKWFVDQELSFAMGFSQIAMFFAFLSGYFVPYTAKQYNLGYSFMIGSIVCLFSFVSSLALVMVDNATDAHDKKLQQIYNQSKS